jgi:PAS domain S-box-containing protein
MDNINKTAALISRRGKEGASGEVLVLAAAVDQPAPSRIAQLERAYELRNEPDPVWTARPLDFIQDREKPALLIKDHGGEVLARLVGKPWELEPFLRIAMGVTTAVGRLHQCGLVHRDIKPANVFVNHHTGEAWLSGFGLASRLPRERQAPAPPEWIAGTLAYMAPEQTGRMNRSTDSRSDLYSLGVTFYEMLTGELPFMASDTMEWIHAHVARQAIAPYERRKEIPGAVSTIVLKLLAKNVEDRYQTAAGVEADLRKCLGEWESKGNIDPFPLGTHDVPDRLLIPEKLYGRKREIDVLLAAFDRVVAQGTSELMLVSGYSGIGKSSVVSELHKTLVMPRGLFASGKFDQYKRDIPYSTLVQAFQSLVRSLLGKSEAELVRWRGAFLEALDPNARLMTDLIPELKLIIGDQAHVPELEPQQAQGRFQLVFRRFIGVFARPEHPLALFLDDLQWLDAATLDLLEDLLTRSDLQHLMLIGAYRDNEVNATHPLTHKLDAIRQAGALVEEIHLAPLACDDFKQLIADALRCDPAHVAPLAQLVQEKTAGNPFFVIQFLYMLAEEGLLHLDHDAACWSWDLDRIRAKGYTDNVVDLLVGRVTGLPVKTQQALRQLACLGNVATIAMLSTILEVPEAQVHGDLWPAVRQELVEHLEDSYKFMHDRVQEAAYSLVPEALRAEGHLRIGRLLAAQTPTEKREEAVFDIVGHLNRGAALITQQDERDQLAELNLIAGKRAKGTTAYASALTYLIAGAAQLAEDRWERRHELTFALELNRAECEFLTGQLSIADERLAVLSNRATTTVEQANVACLHMDVCTVLDQTSRAVAVCLDYLRHVGIEWSPHVKEEEVRREYERIWSLLGDRSIEDLIDSPLMEDAASLATVEVLTKLAPPACFTDANLCALTTCKAVSLSLERGNCDVSCVEYVRLASFAGPRFGDYQAGFRFGQLGYQLVEQRRLRRFEASTYTSFAIFVMPWMKHVRACLDLERRAFEAANQIGDLTVAAYACNHLNSGLLFAGEPLPEVQGEAEHGLAFAEKARFGLVIDIITTQLALIRMLRGLTPKFGFFDDGRFNEHGTESYLSSNPILAIAACWYWIRKLQARYIANDYATAMDAASKAQGLLWTSSSFFEEAEYHFYAALAKAAHCDSAPGVERQNHVDALAAHHRQLQVWAENCPENFENRAALVAAEIARIECRELDAMRLYELAIRSARANGFVHNEAIAYEVAARFYATCGFGQIADLYLRNARYCYLRWGADGKVRQLEEKYPPLRTEEPTPGPTSTIGTPCEHLDLTTVIKVAQAVSGEIVLEKLINTIMRTAIEHAGAERGLLILPQDTGFWTQAEATTSGSTITIRLPDSPISSAELPETVIQYVARTQERVILGDASVQGSFSDDEYIRRSHARSILCLPLLKQGRLIALLYLENNLAANAFTPARIAVLNVLASTAAISLENSRLYREVQEREAKIRRLVDADIIGVGIWDFAGRILEANDAFLHMVECDRNDLVSGRLRWTDLTPAEWHNRDAQVLEELRMTGRLQHYEKELFRKDGSRVPVLIGAATFQEPGNQGVAFVLDLTERKRAEEALRRSEAYLAESQRLGHIGSWAGNLATQQVFHSSDEHSRLYGFDPSEGVPSFHNLYSRIHAQDEPAVAAALESAIRAGRDFDFEFRILLPDGTIRYSRSIGHPQASGEPGEYFGIEIDISESKRAEETIRRSEAYLAEAQKLTHTGSWAWNPAAANTLYWSEEMFRIFAFDPQHGLPPTETFLERLHPEDRDRVCELFRKAVDEKADYMHNHRIVLPDGTVKEIHSFGHPVFDAGEVVEYVGTAMDVTEQVRNRETLEKAFEEIKALKDQLYKENLALRDEVDRTSMFEEIVGASPTIQAVLASVVKVGPTDSTVLITGETGTGKELIARAIHKRSRRSGHAFISVNCAALAPSLISSELFGHEKGAFTGATQRRLGRFELADGGTIFLDEVGEIPPDTQVALLRVLQEQQFERVGGTQPVQVDVRLVAATNRDLRAAIANGTFRRDLFYRLNVFPIEVPPLRERRADILMLVEYFVNRYANRAGKNIRSIDKKTLEVFQSYDWPGNIRELQNVVERSVILTSGDVLHVDESWLSKESFLAAPRVASPRPSADEDPEEREIIEAALRESRGRVSGPTGAAVKLGIPRSTLAYKIKALKIRTSQFKFR